MKQKQAKEHKRQLTSNNKAQTEKANKSINKTEERKNRRNTHTVTQSDTWNP